MWESKIDKVTFYGAKNEKFDSTAVDAIMWC